MIWVCIVGDVVGELAGVQRDGRAVVGPDGSTLGAAVAREGAVGKGGFPAFDMCSPAAKVLTRIVHKDAVGHGNSDAIH